MKRILAVLLSVLFAASFLTAQAEELAAGFSIPELYRTIDTQLDRTQLPPDLPTEAAVITAASFSGTSLSVELNKPVPSLAVAQYTEEEGFVVRASSENASSLSTDNLDDSQGMADIIMTWNLAEGTLTSNWAVWDDGTFDFVQCQYTTESESEQFAPYSKETRDIELDSQLLVLSDTRTLNNETDSYTFTREYDASGKLTDFSCEWSQSSDGTWFFIRSSTDLVPSGISWHTEDVDFTAVSDRLEDYLAGTGLVLDAIEYNEQYISALEESYPQLPEPHDDMMPSTPTDLPAAQLQGTLWCLGFGPEENCVYQPFITADPLFLFGNNTVSLSGEVRDINGTAPAFAAQIPSLPVFELPGIQ